MPVYLDTNGNYYSDTSAHSPNDCLLPNVSGNMLAVLSTTPMSGAAVQAAVQQIVDNAGQGNGGEY